MDDPLVQIGRLAMRREGEEWKAYWAQTDTMDGAPLLGSIRMSLIENNPERKQAFMDLMRECLADMVEAVHGMRPQWGGEKPASEHERRIQLPTGEPDMTKIDLERAFPGAVQEFGLQISSGRLEVMFRQFGQMATEACRRDIPADAVPAIAAYLCGAFIGALQGATVEERCWALKDLTDKALAGACAMGMRPEEFVAWVETQAAQQHQLAATAVAGHG